MPTTITIPKNDHARKRGSDHAERQQIRAFLALPLLRFVASSPLQRLSLLLFHIELHGIGFLDVVETLYGDTALVSRRDLFCVILEAFER